MKKEKLKKRICDYFELDKKRNRILFIFGVFGVYWFLFYIIPILLNIPYWSFIDRQDFQISHFQISYFKSLNLFGLNAFVYFKNLFISLVSVFLIIISNPMEIVTFYITIVSDGFMMLKFWQLTDIEAYISLYVLYNFFIAPILIFIPMIIISRILPELQKKYIILWGVVTLIFSIIYIRIYNRYWFIGF